MPYILSETISEVIPPLWFEGHAYKKQNLYSIEEGRLPPVNYDSHILNAHSLTHIEAETHVTKAGRSLNFYFDHPEYFFGPVLVVKLKGNRYTHHWEVTKEELIEAIGDKAFPGKILLTSENYPTTSYGYHDPEAVLTLSVEAAEYLTSFDNFTLYGTSWKSSDYKPGSPERPVHKTLFKKAVILECLKLNHVPEGLYFLNAFPLKIEGASESPACPVLFTKEELRF